MDANKLNQTETANYKPGELVHKKACKNCFKLHRKCNKQLPCDYCSLRGKPCEINPCIKKRGRPLGSTNKNKALKEQQQGKSVGAEKKKAPKAKKAKIEQVKEECCGETKEHIHHIHHIHAPVEVQHVPVRPFVDEDFSFDNSIVIQGVNEMPQDQFLLKTCNTCTATVMASAKFCTSCGIQFGTSAEMHTKLDSLRWKNTILEQKLHRISTSEGKKDSKSSFPVAPYLASWDFTNFDNMLGSGSFNFNQQVPIVNTAQPLAESRPPSFLDMTEPAILLDSSNIASDQMLNWAFTFEQNFKKEGQEDNGIFGTDYPIFRENFPKF